MADLALAKPAWFVARCSAFHDPAVASRGVSGLLVLEISPPARTAKNQPRGAFVSRDSRTEGEAVVVGIPLYVGGFAGAAAVAAAGGALALAIAATIVGAAAGAGLGAILAATIARRYSARVQEQLIKGGLILWVSVPNPDAEKRAVAILDETGAQDVHVHEIKHEWNPMDIPLFAAQPDPLLEKDSF
jgi:hypothetical protein